MTVVHLTSLPSLDTLADVLAIEHGWAHSACRLAAQYITGQIDQTFLAWALGRAAPDMLSTIGRAKSNYRRGVLVLATK